LGESSDLIRSVLSFELGRLPDKSAADEASGNDPDLSAGPEESAPALSAFVPDGALFYPGESTLSEAPEPQPDASPLSSYAPSLATILAEYGPLPSPASPNMNTALSDLEILNKTSYDLDLNAFLQAKPAISLLRDQPQILILHTHSSEAYSETADSRTLDKNLSVIKVGDVLTEEFEAMGFNVIHIRDIYDYPSYSGSYNRSLEAVTACLAQNPTIQIVIDLHRDALTQSDGSKYRTEYLLDDIVAAQVMLIIATGEAGLDHPNWNENFKLGLRLQKSMTECYPGLARPLVLSGERYNQHTAPGSFIIEVGTDGNSIDEAIRAVRLFAKSAEPVIAELIGDA
jgi:stage II sporulation protein P